jgi:transposase
MESKQSKKATRRQFTDEFRAGVVRLVVEEERPVREVARDLDVHPSLVHTWIRQAKIDRGEGPKGALTTAEREELTDLRKKVRVLEMERALLKKAAAFFAKENA